MSFFGIIGIIYGIIVLASAICTFIEIRNCHVVPPDKPFLKGDIDYSSLLKNVPEGKNDNQNNKIN